ncbi:MAG: hypothetical protein ACE5HE_08285 [Phycisphaerae bacterium]
MTQDETRRTDADNGDTAPDQPTPLGDANRADDAPTVVDGYSAEAAAAPEVVPEDDLDLLDPSTRRLEVSRPDAEEYPAESPPVSADVIETDEVGDADRVAEEPEENAQVEQPLAEPRLPHDVVAHRIAVELKRVELEVRGLLEGRDPKRKRKLSGSRRWRELEDEIIAWHYSDRFDKASLNRLAELAAKRHYLFRQLCFVTGTRPRWNT